MNHPNRHCGCECGTKAAFGFFFLLCLPSICGCAPFSNFRTNAVARPIVIALFGASQVGRNRRSNLCIYLCELMRTQSVNGLSSCFGIWNSVDIQWVWKWQRAEEMSLNVPKGECRNKIKTMRHSCHKFIFGFFAFSLFTVDGSCAMESSFAYSRMRFA